MIKEIPLHTASSCLLILSLSGEHSFIQIKQKTQNNFYADTTRQINHALLPHHYFRFSASRCKPSCLMSDHGLSPAYCSQSRNSFIDDAIVCSTPSAHNTHMHSHARSILCPEWYNPPRSTIVADWYIISKTDQDFSHEHTDNQPVIRKPQWIIKCWKW